MISDRLALLSQLLAFYIRDVKAQQNSATQDITRRDRRGHSVARRACVVAWMRLYGVFEPVKTLEHEKDNL